MNGTLGLFGKGQLYRTGVVQCRLRGFYNDKGFEVPNMAWPGISKTASPVFFTWLKKNGYFGSCPHLDPIQMKWITQVIPKYAKNIFCEQIMTACFKCHVHTWTLKELRTHLKFRPSEKINSSLQWRANGNIQGIS